MDPSDQITSTDLAKATTILNNRIRNKNLSASEVHFCRDSYTGENLHLNDTHLQKNKTHNSPERKYIPSGEIVHTANKPSKYNPKDSFLVTGTDQNQAEAPTDLPWVSGGRSNRADLPALQSLCARVSVPQGIGTSSEDAAGTAARRPACAAGWSG